MKLSTCLRSLGGTVKHVILVSEVKKSEYVLMSERELKLDIKVIETYFQYAKDRYENEMANSAKLYSNINLKLTLTIVLTAALTALLTTVKLRASAEYSVLYMIIVFQITVYGYLIWHFARLFWEYKQGYPPHAGEVGTHFCLLNEYYEENYSKHFTALGSIDELVYKDAVLFLTDKYSEYGKVSFDHNRKRSAILTRIGKSLVLLFATLMISFTMNYILQNGKEIIMLGIERESQPEENPSGDHGSSQETPDTAVPSEPPPPKPVGPSGSIYSEGAEKPDDSKDSTKPDSSDASE
ncbi:hypothetical protein JYU19_01320 [bacterium AH-315-J21]|nr:hypothetical protein [bacterium AH-315-J21]